MSNDDKKPKVEMTEELFFAYLGAIYGHVHQVISLSAGIACEAGDESDDSRKGVGMGRDSFLSLVREVTAKKGGDPQHPGHLLDAAKVIAEAISEREGEYQDKWAPQAAARGGSMGQAHMMAQALAAAQAPGRGFTVSDASGEGDSLPEHMRGFFMVPPKGGGIN